MQDRTTICFTTTTVVYSSPAHGSLFKLSRVCGRYVDVFQEEYNNLILQLLLNALYVSYIIFIIILHYSKCIDGNCGIIHR